jgi:hypothetical protein
MAADDLGNVLVGLTGGFDAGPSGRCLQKVVKK